MKKRYIVIISLVVFLCIYTACCTVSLNAQNVPYISQKQVMSVLEENKEYFNEVSKLYENVDSQYIMYDLSAKKIVDGTVAKHEETVISDLFEKYSFNQIWKTENELNIIYVRPFNHKINIGISYDYESKEWSYIYNHNYDGCKNSHINGYKIFDMIWN